MAADLTNPSLPSDLTRHSCPSVLTNQALPSDLANNSLPSPSTLHTPAAMTTTTHRPGRRQKSQAVAPAQVHLPGGTAPFRPRALLAPAKQSQPAAEPSAPQPSDALMSADQLQASQMQALQTQAVAEASVAGPVAVSPESQANPNPGSVARQELFLSPESHTTASPVPVAPQEPTPTPERLQELGLEPAPGTPQALALLAAAGITPKPAPGQPLGPDDERFSPVAISHLTHRLVEVKRLLEQLATEQKALHETLRLAHLRGDLLHLLAPSSEGWCYHIGDGVLLNRRQGNKKWTYSDQWAEMEAQLKARQTYEQASGEASWRHGAAFWEIRSRKG